MGRPPVGCQFDPVRPGVVGISDPADVIAGFKPGDNRRDRRWGESHDLRKSRGGHTADTSADGAVDGELLSGETGRSQRMIE